MGSRSTPNASHMNRSANRAFNPLMLWWDIAVMSQELMVASATVIQKRTGRMAAAGLSPSASDMREMQLMGSEKIAAAGASASAMARQWGASEMALAQRAMQHWVALGGAMWAALSSTSPSQALARSSRLVEASARSARTGADVLNATGRVARSGLRPIHAAASANAKRLR